MRKYDEVQALLKELRECSSDEAYLSRQAADEITRLHNELHIMEVWSARIIAGTQQDVIEIARLRAEIERLTAERDRQYDRNAEQVTRIAALGAENEKLRTALWDVHALANNGPLVWSKRIKATARAALEGK